MTSYNCVICNFSTNLKTNYQRHLATLKHKKRIIENDNDSSLKSKKLQKNPPKPSKTLQSSLQNPPVPDKVYGCKFCGKEFSRKDNLRRHMDNRCKAASENVDYKEMFLEMKNELIKEKEEFKKQLNVLLENVGNTTNNTTHNTTNNTNTTNITQNIQLNSYGSENMKHITDILKTQMLKIPYGMIPKMIEAVHFNDEMPENKNIEMSNVRDNKVKIFSNNKWIYRDKDETINDLVEGKYFILENHYDKDKDKFNKDEQEHIDKFKDSFNEGDKGFVEKIKKDCELLLINNR
jgi:hypothetical protein